MKTKIKNMINDGDRILPSKFTNDEIGDIMSATLHLDNSVNLSERCYNIINDIKTPVLCKYCQNNKTKFLRISFGYREFCSCSCKNKWMMENTNIKEKISESVSTYHSKLPIEERRKQQNKRLDTMVKREIITDKSDRDSKYDYCREVWRFTNQNDLESLENFNKRGRIENGESFHLDHMYSIHQGFIDCIPPYIIGSVYNLKMIPAKENSSKKEKCSINKEDLFNLFFEKYK